MAEKTKGKVTYYEGSQTGMIITKTEGSKKETHSKTKTSEIANMSAADKIKYATKVKNQNKRK